MKRPNPFSQRRIPSSKKQFRMENVSLTSKHPQYPLLIWLHQVQHDTYESLRFAHIKLPPPLWKGMVRYMNSITFSKSLKQVDLVDVDPYFSWRLIHACPSTLESVHLDTVSTLNIQYTFLYDCLVRSVLRKAKRIYVRETTATFPWVDYQDHAQLQELHLTYSTCTEEMLFRILYSLRHFPNLRRVCLTLDVLEELSRPIIQALSSIHLKSLIEIRFNIRSSILKPPSTKTLTYLEDTIRLYRLPLKLENPSSIPSLHALSQYHHRFRRSLLILLHSKKSPGLSPPLLRHIYQHFA